MTNQAWLIRLFIICLFMVGCSQPNPTPEKIDPIYSDLEKELGAAQAKLEEMNKKLEEARKTFEKSEPRTLERRASRDDIAKYSAGVSKAEEMVEFYKIRVARRLAETRHNYKRAFHDGKPWPDPKEYEFYLLNKKLRSAPQNWSERLSQMRSLAGEAKPAAKAQE